MWGAFKLKLETSIIIDWVSHFGIDYNTLVVIFYIKNLCNINVKNYYELGENYEIY